MKLKCVKPLIYNTRRMVPNDVFETVSERDGKLLLATKKVVRSTERKPGRIAAPTPTVSKQIQAATPAPVTSAPAVPATPQSATKVEVPEGWESLHWTQQVKIAEAITGGELVAAEGETKASKASAMIAAEVARQAAEKSKG